MRRQKILFITTYDPCRMHLGGAAWVDQRVIADLSRVGEVFVAPVCKDDGRANVPLEIKGDRAAQINTLLRMAFTSEPFQTAKFKQSKNWRVRRRQIAEQAQDFDFVVTSQWPALVLAHEVGLKVALHIAHNADYVLAEEHDPLPLRLLRNAARTRRAETALLQGSAKVLALSASDARRLNRMGVKCEPMDFGLNAAHPKQRNCPVKIGFLGKASWPPNARALSTLIHEVMPLVANAPGVDPRLIIAGRGTEGLQILQHDVLGEIESVQSFYDLVDLVVIPRTGDSTGVSVKMLEALERGILAIAPRVLIEDAGVSAFTCAADTPKEMATAIVAVSTSSPSPNPADLNDALRVTPSAALSIEAGA